MIYNDDISLLQSDRYDVLIVGGGAVGLSIASSLMYDGLKIGVVESGVDHKAAEYDILKNVETKGLNIKDASRERMLGGCGQTWAGQLAQFDKVDYCNRSDKYPGLGISEVEVSDLLDQYGHFFKFPNSQEFLDAPQNTVFDFPEPFEKKIFLQQLPIFKFGDRLKHIFEAPDIDLILGWTARELVWRDTHCTGALFQNVHGSQKQLSATFVIIACGCLESTRLLLQSQSSGHISQSLPIGERFMDHPKGVIGEIKLKRPVSLKDPSFPNKMRDGLSGYIGFKFSDRYIKNNNLSNCYFRLKIEDNKEFFTESRELIQLARNFRHSFNKTPLDASKSIVSNIWAFRRGLPGILYKVFQKALKKAGVKRLNSRAVKVEVLAEMSSEVTNRVQLEQRKDGISGLNTLTVSHRLSQNDIRSIEILVHHLQSFLDKNKLGRLIKSREKLEDLVSTDASHHIGGTRITDGSDLGVVNSDFKVLGSKNLYICGGSVLRASGHANPTMLFVGMALKLARHLRAKINIQNNKCSLPTPPAEIKDPEVIIIGAGRRVREDVLPVIEKIFQQNTSISLFARSNSGIFGRRSKYNVLPLSALSEVSTENVKLIYVAVPIEEAPTVAAAIEKLTCKNAKIIWDTPIKETVVDLAKKMNVFVGEDSSYLPWLDLFDDFNLSKLQKILIDRGAFQYHAIALASEIGKKINGIHHNLDHPKIRKRNKLSFTLGSKTLVEVISPRSYKNGHIILWFESGRQINITPKNSDSDIKIVRDEVGRCIGFSMAEKEILLSSEESDLIGFVNYDESVITIMLKIKRAALYRLINDAIRDSKKLNIKEAYADAALFS